MKIGFIGFGNHAERLYNCINNCLDEFELFSFHPQKKSKNVTNNFDQILSCNIVFITSPNYTHFDYIYRLIYGSKCIIFCEKPPCVTIKEMKKLQNLEKVHKSRIFFNFNYRHSYLSKIIQKYLKNNALGKINFVSAIMSHGLAFKIGYEKSWRGQYTAKKSVVLDTSLIHLIDLVNYILNGNLTIKSCIPNSFSHGIDSFGVNLINKYGGNINLHATYAAPYYNSFTILGTNGVLEMKDRVISVFSPRDTFNKEGFFISPPKVMKKNYSFNDDYNNSLQSSVDYFFSVVKNKSEFDNFYYDVSIKTMKILFDCENQIQSN